MEKYKITPTTSNTTRENSVSRNYYVKTTSHYVPPPIGLTIVSMPNNKLFNLYLDGNIDAEQVLSATARQSSRAPSIILQSPRSLKKRKPQSMFGLLDQVQRQKKMSEMKAKLLGKQPQSKRKETLISLTSSTKELFKQQQDENANKYQGYNSKTITMNSTYTFFNKQDEQFIKRCEILAGEKLNDSEIQLLLKKNITDSDMWEIMNKFQKKKWFFEYVQRNLAQPLTPPQSNQSNTLFQKIKSFVQKQPQKKLEGQCQEYYAHIQNIEESLVSQIFKRDTSQKIKKQKQQLTSIKQYRSESEVDRLQTRQKFNFAMKEFQNNNSNKDILKDVYCFASGQKNQPKSNNTSSFKRNFKQPQLPSNDNMSITSQNDSYKSVTEFRLNELYHESKQRQQIYSKEFDGLVPENADQLQRKVKQIVKLGTIQKNILHVVSSKLSKN